MAGSHNGTLYCHRDGPTGVISARALSKPVWLKPLYYSSSTGVVRMPLLCGGSNVEKNMPPNQVQEALACRPDVVKLQLWGSLACTGTDAARSWPIYHRSPTPRGLVMGQFEML